VLLEVEQELISCSSDDGKKLRLKVLRKAIFVERTYDKGLRLKSIVLLVLIVFLIMLIYGLDVPLSELVSLLRFIISLMM
jgi:hypothetical protein